MKSSRMILPAALGAALLAGGASGETVRLTKSDADGKTSFETWDASGAAVSAPWADKDYVVDGDFLIRVRYNRVFGGKSLAFGEVGGASGGLVVKNANTSGASATAQTVGFGNDGAFLDNGYFTIYKAGQTLTLGGNAAAWHTTTGSDVVKTSAASGPITVRSPESAPFVICAGDVDPSTSNILFTNNSVVVSATLKGEAGTAIRLCAGGSASDPTLRPAADTFTMHGTKSAFRGKIIASGGAAGTVKDSWPVRVLFASTFGGTVVAEKGAEVEARYTSTSFSTAGLELQAGSVLLARNARATSGTSGKFVVTESLAVEKGAVVRLNEHPYTSAAGAASWVVLTYPASKGTIPLENFVLDDEDQALPCYLSTNLVDGVWQLVASTPAPHLLAANDDGGTTIANDYPSALVTAESWSDGLAPQGGGLYYAWKGAGGLAADPVVRTPYQAEPFVFAGESLVLGPNGTLLPACHDITFTNLHLNAGTLVPLSFAKVPSHLRGRVFVRSTTAGASPAVFQAYGGGVNYVDAALAGSGTLRVNGRNGSSKKYGDVEFTADNSAFAGKIKLCADVTSLAPSAAGYEHERVFVTDGRNLGGPLADFAPDALELADHSVLEARNDVALDAANRGVTVSGNAGMAAPEGATLAVMNPVSFSSGAVLRKTGAGTLALGGGLLLSGAASIVVEEGFLEALATNAVDGASVAFAPGAHLLVDAAAGDAALAAFGAVDLAADPFGGFLPVAFKLPAGFEESGETLSGIAVATVKDAATAAALAISAKKVRGYAADFSVRANPDGTATILATLYRPAFIMVVR